MRVKPFVFLCILFFYFSSEELFAQEKVDITTCDATSSGVICISKTDTLYKLCVKLKPGPSADKKYKISWGDNATQEITLTAETTIDHTYDMRSFAKDCNDFEKEISLNIKNITNANDNKGFIVTFNKKPEAEPIVREACQGSAIRFDNNTCPSASGTTYLWEFSDGRTSTARVPNISFTDPDKTYSVKLTATSQNCGASSREVSFKMSKLPVAEYNTSGFTVSNADTVVCLANGGVLSLDGSVSKDESQYQWSLSGGKYSYVSGNSGSEKIQIRLEDAREYSISLVARNACGNSVAFIRRYKVISEPQLEIRGQADDCDPIKYKLVNPNPLATYTFNGGPLGHTEEKDAGYSAAPYIIGASITYQCGVKTAKPDTFFIVQKQVVKITGFRDTTLFVGTNAVALTTNINGGVWSGNLIENQGTSKVFAPKTTGTYELTYELGTGKCATSDKVRATVTGLNVVANDAAICENQTTLPLTATPAGGIWTTNDCSGCIKNDTLSVSGITVTDLKLTYTVTAPAGNGKSCHAEKSISVKIGRPQADFEIVGGCMGTNAVITNNSSGATSYQWFVNGSAVPVSTQTNPSFPLPPGNVSVKLQANAGSCNTVVTKQIVVSTPPDPASFNLDKTSGCSPLNVSIAMNGTERNDVTYEWDYGDGNTGSGFSPGSHVFTNQSSNDQDFTIRLTSKNTCGTQTLTRQIAVKPLAKADLGVDSTLFRCSPALVKFSNRSSGNQGGSFWIFGDGSTLTSSADTLSHRFSAKDSMATFHVQLVVSNNCGNDTSKVTINVQPEKVKPLFTMSHITACVGETVNFKDATVPKPVRWEWKFDNEGKAVTSSPTYAFMTAGKTYIITMIAYTSCGYDSIQRTLRVTAPPKVDFAATPIVCQGESARFENKSDGLYGFSWDFGDNSPPDSVNYSPVHTFTADSKKIVTLTGFGASKTCKNEIKKEVFVRSKPTADFKMAAMADTLCSGQLIRLINLSKDATRYTWYFEDGWKSTDENPERIFNAGIHDIALVAQYENTCKDSVYRHDFFAVDTCQIEIPDAFTPNGDNFGNFFTAFGTRGLKQIVYMRIRNRWGEVIFEKRNFSPNIEAEGWDGKVHGLDVPQGEYVYEIEAEFVGKFFKKYTNHFTLIR